jgi:hypothetical protein
VECIAGNHTNTISPGAGAVYVEPVEPDRLTNVIDIGDVDDNAGGEGCEDGTIPGTRTAAIDSDRLGYSDRAETARIERANLSILVGLGDGASVSLARSRATAGIKVIAYPRYPRACGSLGHGSESQGENRDGQNIQR